MAIPDCGKVGTIRIRRWKVRLGGLHREIVAAGEEEALSLLINRIIVQKKSKSKTKALQPAPKQTKHVPPGLTSESESFSSERETVLEDSRAARDLRDDGKCPDQDDGETSFTVQARCEWFVDPSVGHDPWLRFFTADDFWSTGFRPGIPPGSGFHGTGVHSSSLKAPIPQGDCRLLRSSLLLVRIPEAEEAIEIDKEQDQSRVDRYPGLDVLSRTLD